MIKPGAVDTSFVQWNPCHRLIATRFPTVGLFDTIAEPEELNEVFASESMTNDRLRDEVGDIRLVPVEERMTGPGSTPIMASFTHLNPDGSRFSDGQYGVYYCGESLDTAIAEVSHHREVFFRRTQEAAVDIDMRLITAQLAAELHDLRSHRAAAAELYDPDSYDASQPFGAALRAAGSWGIVYASVRREAGECAAVFRPRALSTAAAAAHIALHWDGRRITHWFQKGPPVQR